MKTNYFNNDIIEVILTTKHILNDNTVLTLETIDNFSVDAMCVRLAIMSWAIDFVRPTVIIQIKGSLIGNPDLLCIN